LAKYFEKNLFRADNLRVHDRQSDFNLETYRLVRSSGLGGRSVVYPRTVREALADGPRGPGGQFAWRNGQIWQQLTSRFYRWNSNVDNPWGHCRQSVRYMFLTKRLVTGRGSIYTPCPRWKSLSWHFERFIFHCRALPLLSFSRCLVVASLVRLRASSALHQGFDLCGTRESSSKWLICYSWKLSLPRRLGGGRVHWSSQEDCAWLRISYCERSCAHLTGAVKSNSSGIEVWSGSWDLTGSRSSGALIEERLNIESTSMWIKGDRQIIDTTG
jgi:hypothetical protein